jgi:Bacterial PH domain
LCDRWAARRTPATKIGSSRWHVAAEYQGVELTYRALDLFAGTPGWNSGATRTVGWRLWLAAAAGVLSAVLVRSGPVVALITLALMLALGALLYRRLRRLRIVADEREVVAVNWLRTYRWRWEDIASFEYGPARGLLSGQFYTGRIVLRDRSACLLSALAGSGTGTLKQDMRPRAFVAVLQRELTQRRSIPT